MLQTEPNPTQSFFLFNCSMFGQKQFCVCFWCKNNWRFDLLYAVLHREFSQWLTRKWMVVRYFPCVVWLLKETAKNFFKGQFLKCQLCLFLWKVYKKLNITKEKEANCNCWNMDPSLKFIYFPRLYHNIFAF